MTKHEQKHLQRRRRRRKQQPQKRNIYSKHRVKVI